jgi:nondiscriminating glutamyl-tRNA synthetase
VALLGWAPSGDRTIVSLPEIAPEFDLDRVGRSAAVFDPVKLEWISAQYIHAMAAPRLAGEVARALVAAGRLSAGDAATAAPWIASLAEFLRPSLTRFDQVGAQVEPVFHAGGPLSEADRALIEGENARRVLDALAGSLGKGTSGAGSDWNALRAEVAAASGVKGKDLFQPIRVALTGRGHGRELDRLWPLIVDGSLTLPAAVPAAPSRVAATLKAIA